MYLRSEFMDIEFKMNENRLQKIGLPHKEVMELLSSWTNFRVTASSIICFTCKQLRLHY